jgi:hypothetical protein
VTRLYGDRAGSLVDTDCYARSGFSAWPAGQSPAFYHDGLRAMTAHALKRAFVITGFFVGLDPRKPHGSATFRAGFTVDLWNWREINF